MKYKFNYKNNTIDFWKLSMYFMYGSIVGVCNIIFMVAMILLSLKMWSDASDYMRILLLIVSCIFPILQPLGIYARAKRQAALSKEIEICFSDAGIHVRTGNESSDLAWKNIKRVSKKPDMIIIFSTTTHGFVLTNKVLGKQKSEFYRYVVSKITI